MCKVELRARIREQLAPPVWPKLKYRGLKAPSESRDFGGGVIPPSDILPFGPVTTDNRWVLAPRAVALTLKPTKRIESK